MPISPSQCRAARALFAMTRQELADASEVSPRTIASFEDSTDRVPIAANLAAIRRAFERLGVLFTETGVEWRPPFSEPQTRVIRALQVRNGAAMCTVATLYAETKCSREDLEFLRKLNVVAGIDGLPTLTPIGMHIPQLLRNHEHREARRQAEREILFSPQNYVAVLEDSAIWHAQTNTSLRVEGDGTLTVLSALNVLPDQHETMLAGAREAWRMERERKAAGRFL